MNICTQPPPQLITRPHLHDNCNLAESPWCCVELGWGGAGGRGAIRLSNLITARTAGTGAVLEVGGVTELGSIWRVDVGTRGVIFVCVTTFLLLEIFVFL